MIHKLNLIGNILVIYLVTAADCISWSCSQNGKAMPVIPSQVAGVWYEIARVPSSDVPACLEVIVPESERNGNFTLQLNFINNVNKGWKPTNETLVFPWNEAMNGNFNLHYSDGSTGVSVKFKYLGTMRNYTLVCGYTDLASGLSIIRVLSRNKLVNSTLKAGFDKLASQYHLPLSQLTWVQQDGRCNGSENLPVFNVGLWFVLFFYRMVV